MATTNYFKNVIMGNVFKTATGTALPSNYYIGLSSTTPTTAGGNVTEPSSSNTGYSRVRITTLLSQPSNGVITNSSDISFPESTAAWFSSASPATHYCIFTAETGGQLLMYSPLTNPRAIDANTVVTIKAQNLVLQLTD